MKLRKAMALVATMLGVSCLSVSAMAAEQIVVPIKAENVDTITGYIAEVTYNSDELTPVLVGKDILGDNQYAESNLSSGYLSADLIEPGRMVIGWADKEICDIKKLDNILANVVFEVKESSTSVETKVYTKVFQIAKSPDILSDEEINYSESIVINNTTDDYVESGSGVEVGTDSETSAPLDNIYEQTE